MSQKQQAATITSFKKHLRRTYIFISIQFVITIFIGILTLICISLLAREYLNQVGPLVTTVNRLVKGVGDTMLLLDEWVLTGAEENKKKREVIWDSIIYPTAGKLSVQLKGSEEVDNALLLDLQHLQTEQWITEDLAHTQGNDQALNLYRTTIHDIERKVFSVISQLMYMISSEHVSHRAPGTPLPLIRHLADLRGFFSISGTNLLQCIVTGSEDSEKDFRKNFETARNSLKYLLISHDLDKEETLQINTLNKLFLRYQYQTDKAVQLRRSPEWNLAIYNHINTLEPIQDQVTGKLNLILENRTEMIRQSSTELMQFGHLVILLSTLVGALTTVLLILRARRDILLAGELEESIRQHTLHLEELSRTDQLTGLYNRRAMISLLNQELNNAALNDFPLSFVYFDIDNFKYINDTCGHIAGDQVLRKLADALRASTRKSDFPCRYGGDEFCIILPGCTGENAGKVCEQLVQVLSKEAPGVSLSIGITEVFPSEHIEAEELIKRTDQKMYLGKKERGFQINC